MTKAQALEILKLLSAMEAWSFAEKHDPPDYLLENLEKAVDVLTKEILK